MLGKEPDLPTRQDIHAWSSYTSWRWGLGILHPRSPCLLHTEASLCSALALAQPSPQKAPCSWQNSWHNGCYPTSPPLPSLGEETKSKAGSHILSCCSTTHPVAVASQGHRHLCIQRQLAGAINPWHISTRLGAGTEGEQSSLAEVLH